MFPQIAAAILRLTQSHHWPPSVTSRCPAGSLCMSSEIPELTQPARGSHGQPHVRAQHHMPVDRRVNRLINVQIVPTLGSSMRLLAAIWLPGMSVATNPICVVAAVEFVQSGPLARSNAKSTSSMGLDAFALGFPALPNPGAAPANNRVTLLLLRADTRLAGIGYLTPEGYGPLPAAFAWGRNTTLQNQADCCPRATRSRVGYVRLVIGC